VGATAFVILSAAGAKDLLAVVLVRRSPALRSAAGAKDLLAVALMRSLPVGPTRARPRALRFVRRAQAGPSLARCARSLRM